MNREFSVVNLLNKNSEIEGWGVDKKIERNYVNLIFRLKNFTNKSPGQIVILLESICETKHLASVLPRMR